MKRIIVLPPLLLILFLVSCHKDDWHSHKEYWQLNFDGNGASFQYKYDANRLLTNITAQPWGFGPNFRMTNDAQQRPRTAKDSVDPGFYKYHYQGGRVVYIDYHQDSVTVASRFQFSYDNKGRLARKEGDFRYYNFATYEYAGNSPNFKRANFYNNFSAKGAGAASSLPIVYIDYTYDNEHSPYSTLINTTLIPMSNNVYFSYILFEPVLPNNPTRATFYGNWWWTLYSVLRPMVRPAWVLH
ncbi:hypothetical protein [Paraflavitalea pollutisoli]|uniref:hypothetical protein n=1 Tax=Paraflavitalea pollutisoli TaxID=3034143 RepID=UPI0023ECCB23|nr:hypothetical protein [Paraflavitalea sp. H1-2-19X]